VTAIVEKPSGYVFGIDLGTTNTAISVYKNGKAQNLKVDGQKTMPSVVSVLKTGEILVGSQAKSRTLLAPESTVYSIKRQMGTGWKKTFEELPGREFSATDISAEILHQLVTKVQQNESSELDGHPKYVVVCVPAIFNDAQRKATRKAAAIAGLEVLTLLEEPVAAAYAYAMEKERDQTILIYDLGGGTFDVSILKVDSTQDHHKRFTVLAKEGVAHLGGDDFDQILMDVVACEFTSSTGIHLFDPQKHPGISRKKFLLAQQKILDAVNTAKHELSEATTATIDIPNLIQDEKGQAYHIEEHILTRIEFYGEIRDLIYATREAVSRSLIAAKLTIAGIDRIILVGGSTRIPFIREMLKDYFKKEPYSDMDPDTAIARGAAILGSILLLPDPDLSKPENLPAFSIEQQDIVTHYMGIEVIGGKFSVLIEKGTPILSSHPVVVHNEYTTPRDYMTELIIRVYQSPERVEHVADKGVECIGEFVLKGILPKPKGEERILVMFEINSENLLTVSASSSSSAELEVLSL